MLTEGQLFTAQHGEDQWVRRTWRKLRLPSLGYFVEFGAGDGKFLSNTWWLEKTRGWSGLLCEPDPRHTIVDRPRCVVERVAVGEPGVVNFALTANPYLSGELRDTQVGVDHPEWQVIDHVEVTRVTLSSLLEKHSVTQLDVVSIDTEGSELEAWRTLDLARWRPKLAIIELSTWGLRDRSSEILSALTQDGYACWHRTRHNGMFVDTR